MEENQFLAVPQRVARALPAAQQQLLGYDSLGALGYVDGAKHPAAVLEAGGAAGASADQETAGSRGWDPVEPSSAARLGVPAWVLQGGPTPPLFPLTEEEQQQQARRLAARRLAFAKSSAAAGALSSNSSATASEGEAAMVVVGPSGVGKGTLVEMLMADFPHAFGVSTSHTTRDPRPAETDGISYHFVDRATIR
jgi:hypothetical protein|eukprot:COSAG01_NODE_7500_length_3182_cov_6.344145_2_plen_195_part_00